MKDRTYTPEEIDKKIEALPKEVQGLLYSAEMLNAIQKIGERHKLHIDQIGLLETEVADTMIGFSPSEKLGVNIESVLSVPKPLAEEIARDINQDIFLKIRDSMKRSYEAQKAGNPVAISKPAAPVPQAAPAPAPVAPPKPVEVHPADMLLTKPTSTQAPAPKPAPAPQEAPSTGSGQAKPKPYTQDPYREPTN